MTALPRVGHIRFLNCRPLYAALLRSGALPGMDLVQDTPAALNAALVSGALDIAPISSVEYLRHSDDLLLLPQISVSSRGEVGSILLLTRNPSEEWNGQTFAMTTLSRTSQALLHILLVDHWAADVRLVQAEPDLHAMLGSHDGALLIGDDALRADQGGLHVEDLGAAWEKHTGLPMVYAVWAARRDYVARHPDQVAAVHRAFLDSRDDSLLHVDKVAGEAAAEEPFDAAFLADYFRQLSFGFGPDEQEGLRLFAQRCRVHGLLARVPPLEFALTSPLRAPAVGAGSGGCG